MVQGAVVIATTRRAEWVGHVLNSLAEQSLPPRQVVVCGVADDDFPSLAEVPVNVKCVLSEPGSARQRNVGFAALEERSDFVTFLDDDMILHRDYLLGIARVFQRREQCVCVMGHLLANGGVSLEEARALCQAPPDLGENAGKYVATSAAWGQLYGCNMSFRWSFFEREQFDERLPLYSEMEDVDMGTRARRAGEVGYDYGSLAVHLQAASGRINHVQRGFTQIMNPVYLARKGTAPWPHVFWQYLLRRPLQNAVLLFAPGQGRRRLDLLKGNWFALKNILRNRIEPELLLEIGGAASQSQRRQEPDR